MKRTEIPAAKCYGYVMDGELNSVIWEKDSEHTPCILRTAAADRLILDVVREAVFLVKNGADKNLDAAVQKLEKAGVKL